MKTAKEHTLRSQALRSRIKDGVDVKYICDILDECLDKSEEELHALLKQYVDKKMYKESEVVMWVLR